MGARVEPTQARGIGGGSPSPSRLYLSVLPGWSATLQPGSELIVPGRKVQALLAYLALQGQPQARAKLMTLLWGDHEERRAGQSLRRALYLIRRALGPGANEILEVDGETVLLRPKAVEVDAVQFERLTAEGSAESLERAMTLYRAQLLEGFDLGSPGFEDWLRQERERLYELAVESFGKLLAWELRRGRDEAAVQVALRLLGLDPAQEATHRTLMRLYERQGRRAAALRQYQLCVDVLRREFGVEPERATMELYLEVLQGRAAAPEAETTGSIAKPPGRRLATPRALTEVPLVGRTTEIRTLVEALDEVSEGHGRVVVISGEAGIGKTRLLTELPTLARCHGARVLLGHCHQTEQVLPFRPFIDALRDSGILHDGKIVPSLSTVARAELARLFPELGGVPSATATTPETRAWLFEAVCELLGRMAERESLMLALEDIHWADEMTLRLLAFAARHLSARRVCLVVTLREEEVDDTPELGSVLMELSREPTVARIALGALSEAETRELVAALGPALGGDRATERATRVWRTSRGNPFIVIETLREIFERGSPETDEDPPIPSRVRELLEARLTRLAEPLRHVMAVAAVAGEPASFELLARVCGMNERQTAEAVEKLIRRRILQSVGERFGFSHERVRLVAYETLLPTRRRGLHQAVGEAMEELYAAGPREVDDRLAHHFLQGRVAGKAVTYLTRFAETARRRNALEEALRSLDRAIGLVNDLTPEERDRRRVDLLLKKSFVLAILERLEDVLELLLPLRERVDALGDPAIAGPYYFRLGVTYARRGNLECVDELAGRALEEGGRCRDEATLGRAHYLLASKAHYSGQGFEAGAWHARQAITLLEHVGEAHHRGWSYYMLASHLYALGAFGPALEAAALPEAIGDDYHEPRLRGLGSLLGLILATMGDWEAAVCHCERALERATDVLMRGTALGVLGHVCAQGGNFDRGVPLLEQAIEMIVRVRLRPTEVRFLAFLGDARVLRADVDGAREASARALSLATEVGYPWGRAWAERVLGRAAHAGRDGAAGEHHLRCARDQFEAIGARFEAARTSFDLAELLHSRGRLDESRIALCAARLSFEALGVPIWVARAAELERRSAVMS